MSDSKMIKNMAQTHSVKEGFTLIEVLVSMALVGIAVLGLAQLFTYSILSNSRSEKISSATFLAQQQIDSVRNLTAADINTLAIAPVDENIDVNSDGIIDFRRITQVSVSGYYWDVRVLVFTIAKAGEAQTGVAVNQLILNPSKYRVSADISTVIGR